MKRKLFFLVLILVSVLRPVAGQEPCIHNEVPIIIIQNRGNCGNVESVDSAIIPVVFHIIHLGEPYGTGFNIHDSLVNQAVEKMNHDFRNDIFGDDTKIRFVLASTDPDGNPTNGITRHNGSNLPKYIQGGVDSDSAFGTPEILIKNIVFWDDTKYINFWGIKSSYGNWSGESVGYGLFVTLKSFNKTSTTCSHETGHHLGLRHTFSGYTFVNGNYICPVNNNCVVDGDQVCDTPPNTPYDYGGTCINGDDTNSRLNIMNYGWERVLFTTGQKEKMWGVLRNQRCGLVSNAVVVSGIVNKSNSSITLFPNPTNGKIFIKQNAGFISDIQIRVFNMFGAVVLEKIVPANQTNFELDLSGMIKSMYMVNFSADGVNTTEKIIIQ